MTWHPLLVISGIKPAVVVALILSTLLAGCGKTQPINKPDPRAIAITSIQDYLAGEHGAIWAYGRAAALLPEVELQAALERMSRHKKERNQLQIELRREGATPIGALVAYDPGGPLSNAEQARNFLAGVESRLARLKSAVKSVPSKS